MAILDYRPAKLNRKGRRGDTIAEPITIKEAGVAADLTGRTYTSQLRRRPADDTAIDIDVDDTDAVDGIIVLRLDAATTAAMSGDYAWDLQQVTDGAVRTLAAGVWSFDYDVTRAAP